MLFSKFIALCQEIQQENKRNNKKLIFKSFLLGISANEAKNLFFLYSIIEKNEEQLQIQEKHFILIIKKFFSVNDDKVKEGMHQYGDLACFVESLQWLQNGNIVDLKDVIENIGDIAKITGKYCIEKKRHHIIGLWEKLNIFEIAYYIRIVLGRLAIGLSVKSIIEVLFDIAKDSIGKSVSKNDIEYAFGVSGDLFSIFYFIIKNDYMGLKSILPEPGKFVLCQSSEVFFKDKINLNNGFDGGYLVQPKLDGFRLQAHIFDNSIYLFSRNGINVSSMYPEIIDALNQFKQVNSISNIILDGEVIGFNFESNVYLDFQDTAKRRRKYAIESYSESYSVKYVVFDVLFVNNNNIMNVECGRRFSLLDTFLYNKFIEKIMNYVVYSMDEIELLYKKVGALHEGIMIKEIRSVYEPGKRTRTWLKYKNIQKDSLEDSFDVVVLGYWFARGNRRKKQIIGSLLVGYYDSIKDVFVTIAQVGSGGAVHIWEELLMIIEKRKINNVLSSVLINAGHEPDVFVDPYLVISVKADCLTKSKDHSSGFSLRFPRLLAIRFDKNKFMTNIPGLPTV